MFSMRVASRALRVEIALVRPRVPDVHVVVDEIFDVRVAAQEPEELMRDCAHVQALRRQEREPCCEVVLILVAETRDRVDARAVRLVARIVVSQYLPYVRKVLLDHTSPSAPKPAQPHRKQAPAPPVTRYFY